MSSYKKPILWLVLITTILRVILSLTTELGNVEVYYWSWSTNPKWNYVDHPPMVAWMIYATTWGQTFVNEFTVRLGPILCCGINTLLFYLLGKLILNRKAGWYAALFYSTCIYTSELAGIYVLPDSPQLVFWTVSLLLLVKIITANTSSRQTVIYWLGFGLSSGLCIMCKVHGIFIWTGLILYGAFYDRSILYMKNLYLALFITILIISPIIIWNINHHWYTWHFQSQRVEVSNSHIDVVRFLKEFAGVIFTIGPISFFLIWRGICKISKGIYPADRSAIRMLSWISLPLILLLFVISIFRETYYHWPGPAYMGLLVLPALFLSRSEDNVNRAFPNILTWCVTYCIFTAILQVMVINYFPGTLSNFRQGFNTGDGDATTDLLGWKDAGNKYASYYRKAVAKGIIAPQIPVLCTNWTPAAAIEFYMVRKTRQPILAAAGIDSLHEYYYSKAGINNLRPGKDAIYIVPSNHLNLNLVQHIVSHFESAENVLTIPTYRGNWLCKQVYVFLLKKYKGGL